MFRTAGLRIVIASTLLIAPASLFAASQVTITRVSNNVFVVTGNLQGVAGIQTAISYDSKALTNPRITTGSLVGGMTVVTNPPSGATANSVNPVQIAAVGTSGVTSTGTIATITFDPVGTATSAKPITGMTAYAIDANLAKVELDAPVIDNTGNSATDSSTPISTTTTTSTTPSTPSVTPTPSNNIPAPSGSGGSYIVGGSVTLPSTDASERDARNVAPPSPSSDLAAPLPATRGAAEEKPASGPAAADVATPAPAPSAPAPSGKPVQSVLERFRLFAGDKTVKNLSALFASDDGAAFTQAPAIALTDGKETVKVTIHLSTGDKAPTFSFRAAHFVSLSQNGDGEWQIEVRPDKQVVAASVTIFANGGSHELPLTVAPKTDVAIGTAGEISEADVVRFLGERGTATAPKYDLNGDGRRDYVDDYILVANYLARTAKKTKANKAAQVK